MLIRVISDIHSNLVALKTVLDDPSGVNADVTICLGDVVGYGSHPVECINIVKKNCEVVVAGNHDMGAAGLLSISNFSLPGREAIRWTRTKISENHIDWINTLPLQTFFHGLHLSHASPVAPSAWIYLNDQQKALDALRTVGYYVSLYGHTHIPMHWNRFGECSDRAAGILPEPGLINCGSVGQPRDGDPRAAYLLINTDEKTFRHVRVNYDVRRAYEAIIDAGLPEILAKRLLVGK